MNLPTEEECLELFERYRVPGNILGHCRQVQRIASFLGRKLKEKGVEVNLELIEKAALLHDFLKVVVLERLDKDYALDYSKEEKEMWEHLRERYPGMNEAEVSYLILKEEYPELALLIRNFSDHQRMVQSWEEKILLYADARVLKNETVGLKERMDYVEKKYWHSTPGFGLFYQKIKNYEEEIMEESGLEAERLGEEMRREIVEREVENG